jgi:two-component system NtrC family sensor kinase
VNRRTILVVEDDRAVAQVLTEALCWDGYQVAISHDADSAAAAVADPPAAALIDVMLPGENGLEVFRRIRADPLTRQVPVIFVTALSADTVAEVLQVALAGYHYDAILHKPFVMQELLDVVHRLAGEPEGSSPDRWQP